MGGETSKTILYGDWVGEKKEGETKVLRHPDFTNKQLPSLPTEGVDTVWKAFGYSVAQYGDKHFLGTRIKISDDKYGEYTWKSYTEINDQIKYFAAGLIGYELCPEIESPQDGIFKFLGIYSKNREEWIIANFACHLTSTTVVTFYDTLGEHVIEYILDQTKLTSLMLESKSLKKIIELKNNNKHGDLQNLILLDLTEKDEDNINRAKEAGYKIYHFSDLIKTGKEFLTNKDNFQFTPANPDTIATFSYTSGTTGLPKGAMISHKNIIAEITGLSYTDIKLGTSDVYLSYLPLAHVFEMVGMTFCMLRGVTIGFYQGNPAKLVEDAQLLRPTVFIGVPRVYQRIYDNIMSGINKLGAIKRYLANKAIQSKLYYYQNYGSLTYSIWDRLIFNKTKQALGGRIRLMVTAAAPIDPRILEFLKICFSCPILEGYGQTETSAGATLTRADDFYTGHVGGLMPCNELKLLDCKGLNYKSTDVDEEGNPMPRGEICLRGDNIFKGYFNDLEKTKNTLDEEGWLHTGDVGVIIPSKGNALKIIDRVKNIFKLSHGEYIAPEKIENILSKSKYVSQIFVHGESVENYLVAIVIPKTDSCVEFLNRNGINCDKENIHLHYDNKDLIAEILNDMEELGRKNDLKGFEIVKKCCLSSEPFSLDNDLLTPTMKLKRNEAKSKYLEEIKKMYCN